MGELVGLGFGLGLFAIWSAFTLPQPERRAQKWTPAVAALLARAGLGRVRVRSLLALCGGCAFAGFLVMQLVSDTAPVALTFAVMAGYLPIGVVRARARKRQEELALVWPEAVDNLLSAVRAGMSLPEALASLAQTGPVALRAEFARFALDHHVTGRFNDALDRLKDHLADPVGDRMIEGLRIAREVGSGDLGRLLRNLSHYLREDARTRSELVARQSWTVNGARLALAAPWVVLLLMSFQSGAVTSFSSPGGVLVLAGGAAVCLVAYYAMTRIGRLPVDRRILA